MSDANTATAGTGTTGAATTNPGPTNPGTTNPGTRSLDLRQTLSDLVTSAVNLRVATVVGDVTMSGRIEDMTVTAPAVAKAMVTNIDLVLGDVTTVISPELLGDTYKDLVERHYGAVDSAQKNVKDNIAAFCDLLGGVRNALLPAATPRPDKSLPVTTQQS